MTVGEALAEARYRAGLTVDDLSERTRIREAVIRSIEQDDYDACGGDLYVRGYVRAIAGAIGIDAQPLIRSYDEARAAGTLVPGRQAAGGPAGTLVPGRQAAGGPAVTRADLPVAPADAPAPAAAVATTIAPAPARVSPAPARVDQAMPSGQPGQPGEPGPSAQPGQPPRPRRSSGWWARRRNKGLAIGAAIVVVLALIVAHDVIDGVRSGAAAPAASSTSIAPARQAATGQDGTSGTSGAGTGAASTPGATASGHTATTPKTRAGGVAKAPATAAQKAVALAIEGAFAFGPDGTADGDNQQAAAFAIARDAPLPWETDWYTTASFGGLKSGTGLLLDMGHAVTITSVTLHLGPYRGADLQIRAGDVAALGDLRVAARASDVGGTFRLQLRSPVRARYLLIWFTLLPPNGTGRYQASVYRVVVDGRP